jgi:transcriptional regulator with XRE-family HTH domain
MDTPGERLRWLRTTAGLTTRQLDWLAGLTSGHSTQIENAIIERVSARTMVDIGKVFGVTAEWILDGAGAPPSEAIVRSTVTKAAKRVGLDMPEFTPVRGE